MARTGILSARSGGPHSRLGLAPGAEPPAGTAILGHYIP